jgi:D-glycero-alpha-D-manno-heptose-7-phosphate kinase
MILVRAPLRITFVGDATDLPGFYRKHPGQVLSATIDKFIYLAIKPTHLVNKFIVKYQEIENTSHPKDLKHDRVREALLDLGITDKGLEIGSFADIPGKTGLGSSSSFSVALMKGLQAYLGKSVSKVEAAEAASRLEIELLKEPIGKQDQYAAAFGGFNIIKFHSNDTVTVEPVLLDYRKRDALQSHLLMFYTGLTRHASSVLAEQCANIEQHLETYKKMAAGVPEFHTALQTGDLKAMAELMQREWNLKKTLASNVSNRMIDELLEAGVKAGAWGGRLLGAGSGGCLLFLASPNLHAQIRAAVKAEAAAKNLTEFQEIPFVFTQSGTDVLFNSLRGEQK